MEFRQLEVFMTIADTMSFSKAAEVLFLSQSTVSSHIKALETELGKTLIVRTTRSLSLTPDGMVFLGYVRRIFDTRDAAIDAISGTRTHLISLGASTIPSSYILPPLLSSFREKNPNAYFNIRQRDSDEITELVLDGTLEFGFVGKKGTSSKCEWTHMCDDEIVFAMPATNYYLDLCAGKPQVNELLKEPMIVRESGSGTQKAANQFLASMNYTPARLNIIAQTNDLEATKMMITNGLGISIMSERAVREEVSRGLILTYSAGAQTKRSFYIVRQKSRTISELAREFIKFCKKALAT